MQEQLCAAEARSTALEARASNAEEQSQQLQQALQQQEAAGKISEGEAKVAAQAAAARTAGQLVRELQAYMFAGPCTLILHPLLTLYPLARLCTYLAKSSPGIHTNIFLASLVWKCPYYLTKIDQTGILHC